MQSLAAFHLQQGQGQRGAETAKEVREKEKWGDQIEREPGARERKD